VTTSHAGCLPQTLRHARHHIGPSDQPPSSFTQTARLTVCIGASAATCAAATGLLSQKHHSEPQFGRPVILGHCSIPEMQPNNSHKCTSACSSHVSIVCHTRHSWVLICEPIPCTRQVEYPSYRPAQPLWTPSCVCTLQDADSKPLYNLPHISN
jgi:hypothetical protein